MADCPKDGSRALARGFSGMKKPAMGRFLEDFENICAVLKGVLQLAHHTNSYPDNSAVICAYRNWIGRI